VTEPGAGSVARELWIIAEQELRSLLFGVRSLLLLVLYGGTAAASGGFYLWVARQIEQKMVEQNPALASLDRQAMFAEMLKSEEFRQNMSPVLTRMGGTELLDALASGQMPFVVLVVLLTSTFVLPVLVLIVGYDRVSDDLATKYSRFVLQRVRRGTYLAGKILGHWGVVMIAVIVAHLSLLAAGAALAEGFETGKIARLLPTIWAGMALFLLCYVAFSALFSSLVTPPFAALALGAISLMALWFLSLNLLNGVWMGTWDMGLWVLSPPALLVFLAHALLLGSGAFAVLRWRDV
jgi:ABC-type transport system involved in multi-copper enzyme maturation permease subunit